MLMKECITAINNGDMKARVRIEGFIEVDDCATEKDIEEAVLFQLGIGSMDVDNPVYEPDWDDADVEVGL